MVDCRKRDLQGAIEYFKKVKAKHESSLETISKRKGVTQQEIDNVKKKIEFTETALQALHLEVECKELVRKMRRDGCN